MRRGGHNSRRLGTYGTLWLVLWCAVVAVGDENGVDLDTQWTVTGLYARQRWPNPDGLALLVGKASIRITLGYTDVSDLADASERDGKIAALQNADSCPTGYCVLSLRDRDIRLFAKVVSSVQVRFVLITLGTVDIPSKLEKDDKVAFRAVHDAPNLVAWYTQNYDGSVTGGKMHPFPLGIDYHTIAGTHEQRRGVGGEETFGLRQQISPRAQDMTVKRIYSEAMPWSARAYRLYVGYYSRTHSTRMTSAFTDIPHRVSGVLHQPVRRVRWPMLEDMAKCQFVLAPRGLGMSSIRFYEALAVGSIPVCDRLDSAPMNRLHEKLGAIIVDSWAEVTNENLNAWADAISSGRFEAHTRTKHLATRANRTVLETQFWLDCVAAGGNCLDAI